MQQQIRKLALMAGTAGLIGGMLETSVRLLQHNGHRAYLKHRNDHPSIFYPCYAAGSIAMLLPAAVRSPVIGAIEDIGFKAGKLFFDTELWNYPDWYGKIGGTSIVSSAFFSGLMSLACKFYNVRPAKFKFDLSKGIVPSFEPPRI